MSNLSLVIIAVVNLIAAFLFLFGLWRMSSPRTAASGIRVAGAGMLAAIAASFLYVLSPAAEAASNLPLNAGLALTALILGGGLAWLSGKKVAMTSMPQMIAFYNSMGGGAAGAIAAVALFKGQESGVLLGATLLGALIGAVSFSGSLIAYAKLSGLMRKPVRFKAQQVLSAVVFLAALTLAAAIIYSQITGNPAPLMSTSQLIYSFFALSALFGVLMTLPIGGADMPVVISIYNAFTGLAVGLEGYALQNPALMIAGMVVGAAGLLLTLLMAKAMNRSLTNILFSRFGTVKPTEQGEIKGSLKPALPSDAGIAMRYAASLIVIPGYGLAVSQGQQKLDEFVQLCEKAGVKVRFAVHPVAGRMPGQMDVLLAEAGVPYEQIFQLDEINQDFKNTDMVLVIGANDVVNPAARTDKNSPIFGMPILNADQAKQVYVIKRGTGKGYADIKNALFYGDNCNMVYGDAQAVLIKMIEAVRGLGLDD